MLAVLWPFVLVCVAAGAWVCWRRFRREFLAVAAFFVLYIAAHVVFAVDNKRHVYTVAWVVWLCFTAGGFALLWKPLRWLAARWRDKGGHVLAAAAAAAALSQAGFMLERILDVKSVAPPGMHAWVHAGFLVVMLCCLACYGAIAVRKPVSFTVAVGLGLAALAAAPAGQGINSLAKESGSSPEK